MTTAFVECVEPQGRPMRRVLAVDEGADFTVWVAQGAPGLRRTVLRAPGELRPVGSRYVCALRVDGGVISVVEAPQSITLDLLRGGARSRVVAGVRIPAGAPLELVLPDDERISLSFAARRTLERGAATSVSGSGTRTSRVKYGTDNPWWIILDAPDLVNGIAIRTWDNVRDRVTKLGIDNRIVTMLGVILLSGVAMGYGAFTQYQAAGAATERAETAEQALARAEAAQGAALATEMACLEQRQDLVTQLGEAEMGQRIAAEAALQFTLSRTIAQELAGALVATPEAVAIDQRSVAPMIDAVVARLGQAEGDPAACLAQDAALGKDLPRYVLLWHPDPRLVCPVDYHSGDGGSDKVGRFGLSARVAREFGVQGDHGTGGGTDALEALLGDPRKEDRWSAFTAAQALRVTTRTLLASRIGGRPAVAQSQAHLWSLALLDAVDRMPSPAGGVLDETLPVCVEALLEELAAKPAPPVAGEPVLPPLTDVSEGRVPLNPTPTPGCPWPTDAMRLGTDAALRAVARLADAQAASAAKP